MSETASWLKCYEFLAIWLEGMALVAIFFLDWREYRNQGHERAKQEEDRTKQHDETVAQMNIWRKQIHADRVAEIFKALRRFHNFLIRAIHINKTFGPDRDYSELGNLSLKGGQIFPEYLDLQEAYYLSYLVPDPLAAFMKERIAEADGLQRIKDPNKFHEKLQEFNQSWDIYKMAAQIRELS
ncbi:MAG TPA: hypothetical protein VH079_15505 [Terriglobales bacterium]|nr:hypothetical protein [Terriglobales bacterium]